MTKELFVSSTPHETKVGLVEDDQLAEIYLERENEYTLAGSIYKGRVTRVLPGMQSAFVDIGLERDAFLYVSDFMDLEDHDEDLTEVISTASRPAPQEHRAPQPRAESVASADGTSYVIESEPFTEEGSDAAETSQAHAPEGSETSSRPEPGARTESRDDQSRDRGGFRGRRRRRGRRGERDDRPERTDRPERSDRPERAPAESRFSRPAAETPVRRDDEYGPPPGYQPIILPGESISKYRSGGAPVAPRGFQPGRLRPAALEPVIESTVTDSTNAETFPEDEPLFAANQNAPVIPKPAEEFARQEWEREHALHERQHMTEIFTSEVSETVRVEARAEEPPLVIPSARTREVAAHLEDPLPITAHSGTMEEEEIDEEETEIAAYHEESDEDTAFEELEEETHGADDHHAGAAHTAEHRAHDHHSDDQHEQMIASAPSDDDSSDSIELGSAEPESGESLVASADLNGVEHHEEEGEEDSEEAEIEDAQAEAEALLEAEARGNGTVDARVEVRAPSGSAGYTQRTQRQGFDRQRRGRRGGRRFQRSGSGGGGGAPRRDNSPVPQISDLLKEGQEVLIQIAKEPIGKKGARITSHIALPGRFLVYMPTVNHTGVSRKISSEEERQRLKRIIISERENGVGGFIVRTAASGASEEELRADIRFLKNLWNEIKTRSEDSKAPALIYHDLNVVERVLRDQVTSDFSAIWVDTEQEYERILRFANRFQPALVRRVKLYTKEVPLFEQFGLKEEIDKALKSKVWLKSGGYIVINQTEALVAIDVNTGKYVGKTARLEDTIVKTNVDAIKEIVRQIRLRDLGGIIVIDFIDMDERRNRQRVMQALEEELRHDRAPSKVLQFNDFGLVAITRKRVKQSLERTIGAPCPYCQSTGYVKSVTTVCNEIYVEMRKIAKHLERSDVMLRVNPEVAKTLKGQNGRWLTEMEELTKRTIIVKSDGTLHTEQFDIN
jgi:ribonuclease G